MPEETFVEPLLRENPDRFVQDKITYPKLHELYKTSLTTFWTSDEIDLSVDDRDWRSLNSGEQHFIKHVLAFFANSDGIVNENLVTNFCREVQVPEARCFYGFQQMIENIHSEVYATLLETYVKDPEERANLFKAIETVPAIKKKADWCFKYFDSGKYSFAERLVAFVAVEGIFFSGSFCAIYWLKKRGLMPGLTFSNELIARDEGLHCVFACEMYKSLERPLSVDRVKEIIDEAVQLECFFIKKALPVALIGMNNTQMTEYIKFCADRLLGVLVQEKAYNVANPYDWMELISIDGKVNFFEKRNGEYAKGLKNVPMTSCMFNGANGDF